MTSLTHILRATVLVLVPVIATTIPVSAQSTATKQGQTMDAEQQAIETVLMTQYKAFASRDAASMRDIYSENADWTNAFGRTVTGRDAIISYLDELFADPNFSDGSMTGEPEISVRTVGDDAVAVKVYTQIEGQRTVEGDVLPTRHNYSLKLIGQQPDGSWKIVSELYMDARTEVTHLKVE